MNLVVRDGCYAALARADCQEWILELIEIVMVHSTTPMRSRGDAETALTGRFSEGC